VCLICLLLKSLGCSYTIASHPNLSWYSWTSLLFFSIWIQVWLRPNNSQHDFAGVINCLFLCFSANSYYCTKDLEETKRSKPNQWRGVRGWIGGKRQQIALTYLQVSGGVANYLWDLSSSESSFLKVCLL
jgi:hypothetical protein